eukprot:5626704-Amphidinium_carterae.1
MSLLGSTMRCMPLTDHSLQHAGGSSTMLRRDLPKSCRRGSSLECSQAKAACSSMGAGALLQPPQKAITP